MPEPQEKKPQEATGNGERESTAEVAGPAPLTPSKVMQCAADQFGLLDLFAVGAIVAGQPIPGSKDFVTPGAVPGTSWAAKAADRILGDTKIPFGYRAPTLTGGPGAGRVLKITYPRSVARFAGRAVPVVGWGMLAYDAANIVVCSAR